MVDWLDLEKTESGVPFKFDIKGYLNLCFILCNSTKAWVDLKTRLCFIVIGF